MSIGLHDIEKLRALYPDYQIELREGKLILMSPSYPELFPGWEIPVTSLWPVVYE
jgi:hypothetical protein